MMKKLLSDWLAKRQAKAWLREPVFRAGYLAGRRVLNEGGQLDYVHESVKQELAKELTEHLLKVKESGNRISTNREELSRAVIEMAKMMALLTKDQLTSFSEHLINESKISGDLNEYLDTVISKDDDLMRSRSETPNTITNDHILGYLYSRWSFFYDVHNAMRIQLGDYCENPDDDWARPFIESQLIWSEHEWREKLGLPPFIDALEAVQHSIFLNIVLSGSPNPYLEWKKVNGPDES
jgi:hypothetical protein